MIESRNIVHIPTYVKQRRPTTNTSHMRIFNALRTPLKRVEHAHSVQLKTSEHNILAREASLSC